MNHDVEADLTEMEKKLKCYVDKGRVAGGAEVREEPMILVKPDASLITPLKRVKSFDGHFLAVDCSTRTLKRANNWGIYLLRVSYALVKGRHIDWGYEEKICTEIGDAHTRGNALTHRRIELESKNALKFLYEENTNANHNSLRSLDKGDYILLDGASFFGGKRGFWVSLYEASLRRNMNLLCVSKKSPTLHDERGRDLIATTCTFSSYPIWVYYPVDKANRDKHLYGDVSIIKLCEDSPRAFRCDIMEYLTSRQIAELISPLTSISEDPRCLGYPVPLWLAHDFTAPSDANLLNYLDQIGKRFVSAGILNTLRSEELSCNFADEIHNVRYPFKREMFGDYV
jgi:hypothetical protein